MPLPIAWKERVVVITGASAGIGAALAREVGRRGGSVVLAARRADKLAEVAASLQSPCATVVADVTLRPDVTRILDEATARFREGRRLGEQRGSRDQPLRRAADRRRRRRDGEREPQVGALRDADGAPALQAAAARPPRQRLDDARPGAVRVLSLGVQRVEARAQLADREREDGPLARPSGHPDHLRHARRGLDRLRAERSPRRSRLALPPRQPDARAGGGPHRRRARARARRRCLHDAGRRRAASLALHPGSRGRAEPSRGSSPLTPFLRHLAPRAGEGVGRAPWRWYERKRLQDSTRARSSGSPSPSRRCSTSRPRSRETWPRSSTGTCDGCRRGPPSACVR